jgi:hypothetical protein
LNILIWMTIFPGFWRGKPFRQLFHFSCPARKFSRRNLLEEQQNKWKIGGQSRSIM